MTGVQTCALPIFPPHLGHLSVVDRAIKECDSVVVVLAENPEKSKERCRETNFPYFTPETRLRWFREHYKNNSNVEFVFFDESGLKSFPDGLKEWSRKFKEVVGNKINVKYADESYRHLNEEYFPECEFVPIDRDLIPVHGTNIRTDKNYLKYVIPEGYIDIKNELEKGEKDYE